MLLLLPALLAILGAWYAVRWYVGNTVSEYASTNEAGTIELARLGERWAPSDPFVHWRMGALAERNFSASNLAEAVREYQMAVNLSPNDYRYWGELGRALEAAGDIEAGEKALRRAVDLAPSYSYPRWYLGNLLLRAGKFEEAFQQLTRAAEGDMQFQPQVFNLAWQVFDGNVDEIARVACPSPGPRVQFAANLAARQRFDDAMRIWGSINPADRRRLNALGEIVKKTLVDAKQFRFALQVIRDIEPEGHPLPVAEQFSNGGFEERALRSDRGFDWVIGSTSQVQTSIDTRAHSGRGSLRIFLRATNKLDTIPVSQTVAVEPNTQYQFECYVRTEQLNSGSTPVLAIVDPSDNSWLAASQPLPSGTNDWQRIVLEFKTKPQRDGVTVLIGRAPCTVGDVCPIFGTIWYDDFNLKRIGSASSSRGASAD